MSSVLIQEMTPATSHGSRYVCVRATVMATTPRPYYLFVASGYVTAVFNPKPSGRQMGKTLHGATADDVAAELVANYKRDGAALADLYRQAVAMIPAA